MIDLRKERPGEHVAGAAVVVEPRETIATVRERLVRDFPLIAELRDHRPAEFDRMAATVRDCAEFARLYVDPVALEIDQRIEREPDYFAWSVVEQALPYRLLSLVIPRSVGGQGGLALTASLAMEELCARCAGLANIIGAHGLGVGPLLVAGSIAHWESALRDVVDSEKRGRPVLMAAAVTEPSAGTDVEEPNLLGRAQLSMTASRTAGGYLLNGRKCFISNGSVATYVVVCCATDRAHPVQSWTSFLVHRDMPGFRVGRVEHKMGQRACPAAELVFEDCFVPDENVVGSRGEGMQPGTLLLLAVSRGPVGAIATGIARGAYQWFERWANARSRGRRPADEQKVQLVMAEMWSRIQVARWAYANAAYSFDRSLGRALGSSAMEGLALLPRGVRTSTAFRRAMLSPAGKWAVRAAVGNATSSRAVTEALANASLAKVVGADTAMYVTSTALDVMGLAVCEERVYVEKAFRDARLTQIYEGTNELNRLTVYETRLANSMRVEL